MTDIEGAILDIVARKAKVEPSAISRATNLSTLALDSLDIVEIIFQVEEEFDVSIPYNANMSSSASGTSFATVGEVLDFFREHLDALGKKSPA